MLRKIALSLFAIALVSGCDGITDDILDQVDGARITAISPSRGIPGTDVAITGSGFGAAAPSTDAVKLAAATAAVVSWSDTEVHITVPDVAPGFYSLTLTVGDRTLSVDFQVLDDDADNDGLTDAEEAELGTDPNRSDSDNDGLRDGDEVTTHGTDPLDADSDDDGLTDGQEITITLTNPKDQASPGLDADSDGDGLTNGEEIELGTSLLNDDSDGDGLTDFEEDRTENTDPLDADSDNDGLTDGQEVNDFGFDPNSDADPGLGDDRDADGLTNYVEYYTYGSDPLDTDSDDDGLDDGEEVNTHNSSPTDVDSDDDGLEDGFEVNDSTTDPADADDPGLMSDYDEDGLLNVDEYYNLDLDPIDDDTDGDDSGDGLELMAGTDPNNAGSTPTVHPAWDDTDEYIYLDDSLGFTWDINYQGQPDDVWDDDQDDAFDTGWTMVVYDIDNDQDWWSDSPWYTYSPLIGFSDRAANFPWFWYGNTGLRSRAEIYVPSDAAYFRKWELLENTTDTDQTIEVWYYTNLGSDSGEDSFATSDGDETPEESDNWVASDDDAADVEDGDPAMMHIFADAGSPIRPDENAYCDGDNDGVVAPDDVGGRVYICYTVTVPAQSSVAFLVYHLVDDTLDDAVARADSVATLTEDLLVGLTAEQLALVVNRSIP